jgi:ferredoxin
VTSYAGERLGDVCRKAGVSVMYGCQKGTCGTCEVMLVNEQGGQSEKVRVCEAIVPKNAPGNGPMQYKIQLSDSKVALKRQLDWEQVKDRK